MSFARSSYSQVALTGRNSAVSFGFKPASPRGSHLSRSKQKSVPIHPALGNSSRREFLIRSCQGASILALSASLGRFAGPNAYAEGLGNGAPDFHLHPHYRSQLPLDAMLQRLPAGSDRFVNELYAEQIAALFATWSSALHESPTSPVPLEKLLTEDFSGSRLAAITDPPQFRSGSIQVWKRSASGRSMGGREFFEGLRSDWSEFSRIHTADFQITQIEANLPRYRDSRALRTGRRRNAILS